MNAVSSLTPLRVLATSRTDSAPCFARDSPIDLRQKLKCCVFVCATDARAHKRIDAWHCGKQMVCFSHFDEKAFKRYLRPCIRCWRVTCSRARSHNGQLDSVIVSRHNHSRNGRLRPSGIRLDSWGDSHAFLLILDPVKEGMTASRPLSTNGTLFWGFFGMSVSRADSPATATKQTEWDAHGI